MIPNRLYYTWMQRMDGELITAFRENNYEGAFDYIFVDKEDAYQALEDFGVVQSHWDAEYNEETDTLENTPPEGWKPDGWVLVKTSVEIVDE